MAMSMKDLVLIEKIFAMGKCPETEKACSCVLEIEKYPPSANKGKNIPMWDGYRFLSYEHDRREDEYTMLSKINKRVPFSMLELGNQWLKPFGGSSKKYFDKIGISHTSIDIDGNDLALKLDLTQELGKAFGSRYDLITDFGTAEHVKEEGSNSQYICWKNMHDLCKEGGVFIHVLPPLGFWKDHADCHFWYTEEFFKALAELNDYKIIELYRRGMERAQKPTDSPKMICIMAKTNSNEFVSKQEFDKIGAPPLLFTSYDGKDKVKNEKNKKPK